MSFNSDLKKFSAKAKANADHVVRKTVIEIGESLIDETPVGNPSLWKGPAPKGYTGGRARANWQYGESSIDMSTIKAVDKSGEKTKAKLKGRVKKQAAGLRHFVTNSLPYIKALEDGHSTQAPVGMVNVTYLEFKQFVSKALRSLK